MIKEYEHGGFGECEQCGDEDELFYDDMGNLLCNDCIFENNIDEVFGD